MSRRNPRTGLKTKTAALLILALLLQNAFFAFADIRGAGEASENTETEVVLQSANTSFVSFPSRFSDVLPEGLGVRQHAIRRVRNARARPCRKPVPAHCGFSGRSQKCRFCSRVCHTVRKASRWPSNPVLTALSSLLEKCRP